MFSYNPDTLRAARALVGLDAHEFARLAKVSRPTLRRAESGEKYVSMNVVERIKETYEELGIEFTLPGPGYGAGVRWRRSPYEDNTREFTDTSEE